MVSFDLRGGGGLAGVDRQLPTAEAPPQARIMSNRFWEKPFETFHLDASLTVTLLSTSALSAEHIAECAGFPPVAHPVHNTAVPQAELWPSPHYDSLSIPPSLIWAGDTT